MEIDDDTKLRVRIEVRVLWREPPATAEQGMLRAQAEVKVQAMAQKLERGVEQMLIALLPTGPGGPNG